MWKLVKAKLSHLADFRLDFTRVDWNTIIKSLPSVSKRKPFQLIYLYWSSLNPFVIYRYIEMLSSEVNMLFLSVLRKKIPIHLKCNILEIGNNNNNQKYRTKVNEVADVLDFINRKNHFHSTTVFFCHSVCCSLSLSLLW